MEWISLCRGMLNDRAPKIAICLSIIDCLGLFIKIGWWAFHSNWSKFPFQAKLCFKQQEGSCEMDQSVNHMYWPANIRKLLKVRHQFPMGPVLSSKILEVSFAKWHRILGVMAIELSWTFLGCFWNESNYDSLSVRSFSGTAMVLNRIDSNSERMAISLSWFASAVSASLSPIPTPTTPHPPSAILIRYPNPAEPATCK